MAGRSVRVLAAVTILSACVQAPPVARDDPLVGQIYDARTAGTIDRGEVLRRMLESDVVYIGETHDNLEHQAIQLELLQALVEAGARPALGAEFFYRDQTATVMLHLRAPAHGHGGATDWRADLREALGWGGHRDADWQHYEPLLAVARESELSVFGADLRTDLRRRISRVGLDGLYPVERLLLPDPGEDDPEYKAHMFDVFTAGHCGWRNEALMEKLYATWRVRNQAMAEAVVAAAEAGDRPVVLITGAGHVEGFRGVYSRVARIRPQIRQFNLGLRQITIEPRPLSFHLGGAAGEANGHDVLWFTQRSSYVDPCERFRRQLSKPPGG